MKLVIQTENQIKTDQRKFFFYFKVSVLKKILKQQSYCMEIRDLSNLKVKTFAIQFTQLKQITFK